MPELPSLSCPPAVALPGEHRVIPAVATDDPTLLLDAKGAVVEVEGGALQECGFRLDCGPGPVVATVHGDLLVAQEGDGLRCRDVSGVERWGSGIEAEQVCLGLDGSLVWVVERVEPEHIRLHCLDAINGGSVAVSDMMDPFFASITQLDVVAVTTTPGAQQMMLNLGGGQDGIGSWLLTLTQGVGRKEIRATQLFPRQDRALVAWSPSGRRALVWDNDEYRHLSCDWAGVKPAVTVEGNPEVFVEAEGAGFWETFLTEDVALTRSGDDRFWLLDPVTLTLGREFQVEGFPPVPVREVFGNSSDDVMAPFHRAERAGHHLVLTTWAKQDGSQQTAVVDIAEIVAAL
ncbi:MAG: hypothetical protein Q4D96_13240 [Propionibacteriaceae bacterium]|nr:hypothetical protein [Propionibacteriaceae bacterium]